MAYKNSLGGIFWERWKFWVSPPGKKSPPPLDFELFQIQVIDGFEINANFHLSMTTNSKKF